MGIIEVTKDSIEKLKILEWSLVIELDEGEVAHERRSIETVNDDLNLVRAERRRLREQLGLRSSITEDALRVVLIAGEHLNSNNYFKFSMVRGTI